MKKKMIKRLSLNKETLIHLELAIGGTDTTANNAQVSDTCQDNGSACGQAATTNLSGNTCRPCLTH